MKHAGAVVGGIIILGLIGLKVYNRTPRWETIQQGSETIPAGQHMWISWSQSGSADVKFEFRETGSKEVVVSLMDKRNYEFQEGLQERLLRGEEVTPEEAERIETLHRFTGESGAVVEEVVLGSGDYYLVVESPEFEEIDVTFDAQAKLR